MYYFFDGSYHGFLCCIFESFERKEFHVILANKKTFIGDLFAERREIFTDEKKAARVQKGLYSKIGKRSVEFYHVFLSEDTKALQSAFNVVLRLFSLSENVLNDYGNEDVLFISQIVKKVSRERHRMKAFIRFQKSSDGMYFSVIEPDFNVLPLIAHFFKKRYADQSWLIYDLKRSYGLLYDLQSVSEVTLTKSEKDTLVHNSEIITVDNGDLHFQQLWERYYKSTNIEARKNVKLHLQHVPKRYWKYLTEKTQSYI